MFGRLNIRSLNKWVQLDACYPTEKPIKLNLLTTPGRIRCGLVLPNNNNNDETKLLNSLVIDVHAKEQTWMQYFSKRFYNDQDNFRLIKYGETFNFEKQGNLSIYTLPSSWLKNKNVEFIECSREQMDISNDQCHFYISINSSIPAETPWPTLNISLTNDKNVYTNRQVNINMAWDSMLMLSRKEFNSVQHLEYLKKSNFVPIHNMINHKLKNVNQISQDLAKAVLTTIYRSDSSINEYEKLLKQESIATSIIEQWACKSHNELQNMIKASLQKFNQSQLSVWKLYIYSESALSLKLREMSQIPLDLPIIQNLNYVRGQLDLPIVVKPTIIDNNAINTMLVGMHKRINMNIYKVFFQLQLPLIFCSCAGIISGQFSSYSMGSLAGLGIILGLRNVMKSWSFELEKFQYHIIEQIRLGIELEKEALLNQWNKIFASNQKLLNTKMKILKELNEEFTSRTDEL